MTMLLSELATGRQRCPGASVRHPSVPSGWLRPAAAAWALALAAGALAAVLPEPPGGARAAPSAATATPTAPAYGCRIFHDKRAGPPSLPLGPEVEITLTARAECIPHPLYLHVVIVVDQSEAMAGRPLADVKADARHLVEYLDLDHRPDTFVALVTFDDDARTVVPLTNNAGRIQGGLGRLDAGGQANVGLGLREALRALLAGRRMRKPDWGSSDWTTEMSVLYSLGRPVGGCATAAREAIQLRGAGILSTTVCAGSDCDERCLVELASHRRYAFELDDPRLIDVLDLLRDRIRNTVVREMVVTDTLSADLLLVEGSVHPTPHATDPAGRWLAWREAYVPRDGLTFTFRARPVRTGILAANERAVGHARSSEGQLVTWAFAIPTVEVFVASPTPIRTATPTPSATPRLAPATAPVAWRTATPAAERYLPQARR